MAYIMVDIEADGSDIPGFEEKIVSLKRRDVPVKLRINFSYPSNQFNIGDSFFKCYFYTVGLTICTASHTSDGNLQSINFHQLNRTVMSFKKPVKIMKDFCYLLFNISHTR